MKTTENSQENFTSAVATFYLDEIKKGMYICWNVCALACYDSKIVIRDDCNKIYAELTKTYTNTPNYLFMGDGAAEFTGNRLRIEVTSNSATRLEQYTNKYKIAPTNSKIQFGYNIYIEDDYDYDYNDVCINIVSWLKKG